MKLAVIHFEHALPPLAEAGLEHVIAPIFRAVLAGGLEGAITVMDEDTLAKATKALAGGASSRAMRRLLAVLKASADDLLQWEEVAEAEAKAVKAAALLDASEAQEVLADFFSSLGLSQARSQGSSVSDAAEATQVGQEASGLSASFLSPS